MKTDFYGSVCTLLFLAIGTPVYSDDPLPSWNDNGPKRAIIDFVEQVTCKEAPTFVAPAERIATFDNDGCLWAEQPFYFQALFAMDQVARLSKDHPQWSTTEPFKSALENDLAAIASQGKDALAKIVYASHTNIDADAFSQSVKNWLASAKHPETGMLYRDMLYKPMLELFDYLRANEFKTYIVSGGGIDFLRVFSEHAYGIPPEQVIGSSLSAKYEMRDGIPVIVKLGDGLFVDDKAGKPIAIYQHVGRRPIFAAGNSDGDLQMLQYTTISRGPEDSTPRFGLIVHHTDGEREWKYDRNSPIGKLDEALNQAAERRWVVVDMANDWNEVFRDTDNKSAK